MTRILLIEDNEDLAFGLRSNLEFEGYEVAVAHTAASGIACARSLVPNLLVLDLMLPDASGYDVLTALRRDGLAMPVLLLTARDEELDKVRGFKLGADDYVTKPFGLMELAARIEALLRRSADVAAPPVFVLGEYRIDVGARRVVHGDAEIPLAPKEFDLLVALAGRAGDAASRTDLLREVWGHGGAVVTRTVDTHIAELRRKLEHDPAAPRLILTVRKVGYRLAQDA